LSGPDLGERLRRRRFAGQFQQVPLHVIVVRFGQKMQAFVHRFVMFR